jgi:alpha-L-rhamnosidase
MRRRSDVPGATIPLDEAIKSVSYSSEEIVRLSRECGPDQLPEPPALSTSRIWFYAPAQFEIAALHSLVEEGFQANRRVDYAMNYGSVNDRAQFRCDVSAGDDRTLFFWATGVTTISVDGTVLATYGDTADSRERPNEITVPKGARTVELSIVADRGIAAAFAVPTGAPLSWMVHAEDGAWIEAVPRAGGLTPPHEDREAVVDLPLREIKPGTFALAAPVLGRIVIHSVAEPVLGVGESLDEAAASEEVRETRCDVELTSPGIWTSRHRHGFRYVTVSGAIATEVHVLANVRAATRRGAFLSDDPVLNRIWATSSYTLRMCMQVFMLDGIKRDRMPWIGDYALSILSNAYAFGDGEVIRNGLTALGRVRHGYVNGISDYSLWWVISHELYQRYIGDLPYLVREAAAIHAFLETLAEFADEHDVFRPRPQPDAFPEAGPGAVFIDWGVSVEEGRSSTALQMLWYWAVSAGARLLRTAGHESAHQWQARAGRIGKTIQASAWDDKAQAWREYLDDYSEVSPYPNFLAVESGLMLGEIPEGVRRAIRASQIGTPFMRSFALRARSKAGESEAAVAEIKDYWGAMLDVGAQTFWEEFGGAVKPYEMYGRPFGKSLCHAWAAGPAELLPELVLGVRPLDDGWALFEVVPRLGPLGWAAAVVPTASGQIVVRATANGAVHVEIPSGLTLVRDGGHHVGPAAVTWEYNDIEPVDSESHDLAKSRTVT